MKKILLAVAAIAMVGMFTVSCNKNCTCKTYLNGTVIRTTEDIEVESGKKCKDMDSYVTSDDGLKTGTECKTSW